MKHFGISIIYVILFALVISGLSAIFNESFEYLSIYFLIGITAGLLADKHTKEGR